MPEPYILPPEHRAVIDRMVEANRTDRAMLVYLTKHANMSRHDAHVAIDHYVYGEPITCQPIPLREPVAN